MQLEVCYRLIITIIRYYFYIVLHGVLSVGQDQALSFFTLMNIMIIIIIIVIIIIISYYVLLYLNTLNFADVDPILEVHTVSVFVIVDL